MADVTNREPWVELKALVKAGDPQALVAFIDDLPPQEIGRSLSRLTEEMQTSVLNMIGPEEAADLLEHLSEAQAVEILDDLPPDQAAAIVDELPSDEQADILGELEEGEAAAILERMDPEEAADARRLLQYSHDTAGGIMHTEYLCYAASATVEDVIQDLRSKWEEYADYNVQYAYISDVRNKLVGVLRFRDLLLSEPVTRLQDLMIPDPISVAGGMPLEELIGLFNENNFIAVPVVEEGGVLIGVVLRSDARQAAGERATENFLKVSGLVGEEELRSMPMFTRSSRRLSWLSINIILNVIAASVIAMYQETLSAVIALAVFLPIISDMSGCCGNQAVAVSIRELSLGLVKPYELFRVFVKEISVGLMNGLCLGLLLASVAWLWKGNPWLGFVVGGALMVNTIVAVVLGGLIPLILKRMKMDPALASGPILTTVTDMCGFFFVLSFATALLPKLSG